MSERADLIAARDVLDAIDAQTHKGAGLDPHPDEKWSVALTAKQWAALAQAFDNIVWSVSPSGRENEELKSERADLIAAKERLTKSAAISTMATSGRSRSYDGHQMQMVRLEDLRLLLAENSLSERENEELKKALEPFRQKWDALRDPLPQQPFTITVNAMLCCDAALALRQHEDGK